MNAARTDRAVDDKDYVAIQRFMYREASFLDRREYQHWLGLLTDDIVYRVSARVSRDAEATSLDYAIIDEDASSLKMRVEQISNPRLTRAENPPAFTRRFVSNFEASLQAPDRFAVDTNLLIYRNRMNIPNGGFYVGERHDLLRRIDGDLRLAQRHVRLDQAVLHDGAVSTLF
jgi:3-phenylpropionate/cinnamic acid dioxygenase small subunit